MRVFDDMAIHAEPASLGRGIGVALSKWDSRLQGIRLPANLEI